MDPTFIDRALGSDIPYITYAVPFFFLLIGVELAVALWQSQRFYRLHDSINDLSCGSTEQVIGIFLKGVLFAGYQGTYAFAIRRGVNLVDVHGLSAGGKWAAAIVLFLGVDCAYYWFHRIAHEYNAPWAGHVVHHSSEDYNLAVALRQGAFQGLFSWVFYLPLALVGFPPSWFAAIMSFNLLYQFWIHTRAIKTLGPLEWVLNTPSHHRVHHARNPKYLDKNYAGTLIIWDRMFGTFKAEEEEPVYGLTKPLNSWNPLWANLHVWHDLFRDAWLAPRRIDKLRIWFMPQGWRPEGLPRNPPAPKVTPRDVICYDTQVPRVLDLYALAHFVAILPMTVGLMGTAERLPRAEVIIGAVLVLWALLNLGGIFDHRRWAFISEWLRLPATAAAVGARLPDGRWSMPTMAGLATAVVASWACLVAFRRIFDGTPQSPGRAIGHEFVPHGRAGGVSPLSGAENRGS
jgi:sterol desaturase/sphingolipid hydroxylase (fatty acid hydroxylase superfamily)